MSANREWYLKEIGELITKVEKKTEIRNKLVLVEDLNHTGHYPCSLIVRTGRSEMDETIARGTHVEIMMFLYGALWSAGATRTHDGRGHVE